MAKWERRKSIPWQIKDQVWDKTRGRCWYCGLNLEWEDRFSYRRPNIEHQEPHHLGGSDSLDNLVLACYQCNVAKCCERLEDFRKIDTEQVADFCDAAIDHLADLEWWFDNQREREAIRKLADIRDFYRAVRVCFFGEQVGREWCDYTI